MSPGPGSRLARVLALGERQHRWLRFLLSGGAGFTLYYLLSLALDAFSPWADGTCAFLAAIASVPPTSLLQQRYTFRSERGRWRQALGYGLLQLACAVLVGVAARHFDRIGLPSPLGFFLAGLSGVLVSYLVQSRLIFSHRRLH